MTDDEINNLIQDARARQSELNELKERVEQLEWFVVALNLNHNLRYGEIREKAPNVARIFRETMSE